MGNNNEEARELFNKVVDIIRQDFRRLRQLTLVLEKQSSGDDVWAEDIYNDFVIGLDAKIKNFVHLVAKNEFYTITVKNLDAEVPRNIANLSLFYTLKEEKQYIENITALIEKWEFEFNHNTLPAIKEEVLKNITGYEAVASVLKKTMQYLEFSTDKTKYVPPRQDEIEELLIKIRRNAYKDVGTVHNDYRTALNKIVEEFFGVNVTNVKKLIEITGQFEYPTDSSIYEFYNQGSQKQHKGRSRGSIDAAAAVTTIENYYKILKSNSPNEQTKQKIKTECKKHGILFKRRG